MSPTPTSDAPPSSNASQRAASATPPPPILEPETNKNLEVRLIPRLVDTEGQTAVPRGAARDENLDPSSWNCEEVAQFLEINEIKCDPLVEAIIEKVIEYIDISRQYCKAKVSHNAEVT